MDERELRRIHDTIDYLGMRAQATAAGLIQLTIELRRSGVIEEDAVARIKESIANEVALSRPRVPFQQEVQNVMQRLDKLFSGQERLTDDRPAEEPFAVTQ